MDEEKKKAETNEALKKFDAETRNRILAAMALVKETYERPLRKMHALNPKYKRVWRTQKHDEKIVFAYDGTPDKGFVCVNPDYTILALDGGGNLIKKFE